MHVKGGLLDARIRLALIPKHSAHCVGHKWCDLPVEKFARTALALAVLHGISWFAGGLRAAGLRLGIRFFPLLKGFLVIRHRLLRVKRCVIGDIGGMCVLQLRIFRLSFCGDPRLNRRASHRCVNQADWHAEFALDFAAEEVKRCRESADALGGADFPFTLGLCLRRGSRT